MSGVAPLLDRDDTRPLIALAAGSLALYAATAVLACRGAGVPFGALAAYYDGYLYLDIAKSFPLPFDPAAVDYAGHAIGYPAAAALVHALLPVPLAGWNAAMLLVPWLAGALSTVAFYALCKAVGTPPRLPTVIFLLANPLQGFVVATAHPEPLALGLALLGLVAFFRDRPLACFAWLAAATLVRYPALLLTGPLVLGFALRGHRGARTYLAAGLPALALAALHAYLIWRIPGFTTIWDAHKPLWDHALTWPFAALWTYGAGLWATIPLTMSMTYALLLVYLMSIVLGFRESDRALWVLPLWIATPVLFQASLSGVPGVLGFARLASIAWPAAVLVLWRRFGARTPAWPVFAVATALGAFGVWFGGYNLAIAARIQGSGPELERFVAGPEPVWLDLRRGAPGGVIERVRRASGS